MVIRTDSPCTDDNAVAVRNDQARPDREARGNLYSEQDYIAETEELGHAPPAARMGALCQAEENDRRETWIEMRPQRPLPGWLAAEEAEPSPVVV